MLISKGYQSTSIFSGEFKKAYFAFGRRWAKGSSVETHSVNENLTYIQPSIPPEAHFPRNNDHGGGGISHTVCNIFERFRRPIHDDTSTNSGVQYSQAPEERLSNTINQPTLDAFAATDVYIKHCDLRKDGASMQSLSQVDATRRSSPCSYYQFAKGIYDRLSLKLQA